MTALLDRYRELVAKVDEFWNRAHDAQPHHYRCREGCDDCCRQQLTVFPVEAVAIRAHLEALGPSRRDNLAERARALDPGRESCVFLTDGRCDIYPVRPLICRTHGLAIRVGDRIDWCPQNFTDGEPLKSSVMELDRINPLLALVDRLHAEAVGDPTDRKRIPLTTLAADPNHRNLDRTSQ